MPDRHEIQSTIAMLVERIDSLRQSLDAAGKAARLGEIDKTMAAPDFWNDQEKALALVEERKALKAVLDPLEETATKIKDARELFELAVEENDAEVESEAGEQIVALPPQLERLEFMSLLSAPHDREPCFFSIHTGAGGSDACEWAEMLLRMYTRFFERQGWKVEELSFVPGEEAGIRGVELRVGGAYAFGQLKGEIGVHRLVRISPFSGRRETSFAAVDVTPDFQKEVEIEIEEKDLKVDTYRAGGKGGQHVNTTDSAVRLTHLPTGTVVCVQNERSQHRNKDMALKILKSRLAHRMEQERLAAASARNASKMENAWGSQIRNYVLHPYQMVKDVRTGCETGDIQKVLDGHIDDFLDAYLRWAVADAD